MTYCIHCGERIYQYYELWQHDATQQGMCADGGDWAEPAPDKRFADAELAAEFWRKAEDFTMVCEGYPIGSDNYTYAGEDVEKGRLATLERFATHPHIEDTP